MLDTSIIGFNKKKLQLWLLLFFLALAIPTAVLIRQAYSELKWEAVHQHRLLAEELATRIDSSFIDWINAEEVRPFSDYAFLNVAGDPSYNFLQRSRLSEYPVKSLVPGLLGYFQVNTQGVFSTPLLPHLQTDPTTYGIAEAELAERLALQSRIQQILSKNRLVQSKKHDDAGDKSPLLDARIRHHKKDARVAETKSTNTEQAKLSAATSTAKPNDNLPEQVMAQAAFDQLHDSYNFRKPEKQQATANNLGRVSDLKLDNRYQAESDNGMQRQMLQRSSVTPKRARKEQSALPEPNQPFSKAREINSLPTQVRITTFESEIDPFELSLLDSGHFVLFRKVWRDGQRYIQGALIEQQPFLHGMINATFRKTALSQMSDLIVAHRGNVLSVFSGVLSRRYLSSTEELRGALLYQMRLSDPISEFELIFSINQLPSGPGEALINWITAILVLVLCGGFYLMYRLGAGQIELAHKQQDFISAVSHELKTPLTSIRMYGEMLREGWASEAKKSTYYDFIFYESERLSRLINNVLQLARLTRNCAKTKLKTVSVVELIDSVNSTVSSQIERAGFTLQIQVSAAAHQAAVSVDTDHFIQIVINLVDNALKFAAKADKKVININCNVLASGIIRFSVRDFGPGIPRDQIKKIFKLFYRMENELTRETVGTGIGLALVHQLVLTMDGQVDVVNTKPGAEFIISFAKIDL